MILIVNIGIPGSGKSSMSEYIKKQLSLSNISCSICNADFYHIIDGKYQWQEKNAFIAHLKNNNRCKKELLKKDVCIYDNTNTNKDDFRSIVFYARKYNAKVLAVLFLPKEVESHFNQGTHNVSIEKLKGYRDAIDTIDTTVFDNVYKIDCNDSFEKNSKIYDTIIEDIKNLKEE